MKIVDSGSELVERIVSYGSVMADGAIKHLGSADLKAHRLVRSADKVAELVNHCFWVSLAQEEGRPVRGSIAIASPDDPMVVDACKFESPVLLTRTFLATLLTAAGGRPVAVHLGDEGFEIWGYGKATLGVVINLVDNACLSATTGSGTLGILSPYQQVTVPPARERFHINWISECLSETPDPNAKDEKFSNAYQIARIGRQMWSHRHGGILAIAPDGDSALRSIDIPFALATDPGLALRTLLTTCRETQKQGRTNARLVPPMDAIGEAVIDTWSFVDDKTIEQLARHQELLGAWTSVDGCLVLTTDLRVVGFGGKLKAAGQEVSSMVRVDALSGTRETCALSDLGGMRHQSAARFVAAFPSSFCIVASMDGRVTGFRSINDSVEVVRGLESFYWSGS